MSSQSLLKLIAQWHDAGKHTKIVEALSALPENERDYNCVSYLARALNNINRFDEALALLESIREQGREDAYWHFRMGYSLFYIDGRETEAIPYLERAIELGDDYPATYELLQSARRFAEGEEQSQESEEEEKFTFEPKAYATLSLNMRLQPQHREDNFADGIDMLLRAKGWGCVSGGGTMTSPEGEPLECDIEIDLAEDSKQMRQNMLTMASRSDVAKGSKIVYRSGSSEREQEFPVGNLEGIAVYINATDLPDEVYEECDISHVISSLGEILGNNGAFIWSYWSGPKDTGLYFYSDSSAEEMLGKARPFLDEYPLCRECRTELLAHDLPDYGVAEGAIN
ncbi:MAG: tetratricopeptide repeat protein [Alistipes sp.]|jgi:tetratricopeptide (TPR) repeat protein|nr:tetratricopeptide repeat protein [Alistipes sp.]